MPEGIGIVYIIVAAIFAFGILAMIISWYKKVPQGKALVTTGIRGARVAFEKGLFVWPVVEMVEQMDLSVRTIEISRMKEDGLICRDNIRADIKVVFFVRINKNAEDIRRVAQSIGCERASNVDTMRELFEAKFSEAIKTVGKRFDFVELYDNRDKFNTEIQDAITELNGYKLDDCAIDYLEQTDLEFLKMDNILDAEGIKKITELTAAQKVKANFIRREEEKTLKEQDVEAREAILEYERQLAEKEERQRREIANIKAREEAEIQKVEQEEKLKSESVRIQTEEALMVAEENKLRQIIVAAKNKERTEAVENERVEKDRLLEHTERLKIVALADIEKERAIEEERKNIQDVIRDRIVVEKKVVEEEEKIKDTRILAEADRLKQKTIIESEAKGEATVIEQQKTAEAEKLAAEIKAQTILIEAEAQKNASEKEAEARKIQAEAKAAEEATIGLSEAQVIEAKAHAKELEGNAEATVLEKKAMAEAKGIEARSNALREQGLMEAQVESEKGKVTAENLQLKLSAEAKGVEEKAVAMQKLDEVTKEHEEYRLRLEQEKEIAMANFDVQKSVAEAQASVMAEAMKQANIDIVGGETQFVNSIMNSVSRGKSFDQFMDSSTHLQDVKQLLLGNGNGNGNGNGGSHGLIGTLKGMVSKAGLGLSDIKDLSLAGLLYKLTQNLGGADAQRIELLEKKVHELGIGGLDAKELI